MVLLRSLRVSGDQLVLVELLTSRAETRLPGLLEPAVLSRLQVERLGQQPVLVVRFLLPVDLARRLVLVVQPFWLVVRAVQTPVMVVPSISLEVFPAQVLLALVAM